MWFSKKIYLDIILIPCFVLITWGLELNITDADNWLLSWCCFCSSSLHIWSDNGQLCYRSLMHSSRLSLVQQRQQVTLPLLWTGRWVSSMLFVQITCATFSLDLLAFKLLSFGGLQLCFELFFACEFCMWLLWQLREHF